MRAPMEVASYVVALLAFLLISLAGNWVDTIGLFLLASISGYGWWVMTKQVDDLTIMLKKAHAIHH